MTYPAALSSVPNAPAGSETLGGSTPTHTAMHQALTDAVNETQAALGTGFLGDYASLAARLLGRAFDARAYGATGDGTTDDTAAIQSAVDAASAAGGGAVWLPPGTYKVSRQGSNNHALTLPSGVTLAGAGRTVSVLDFDVATNAAAAGVTVYVVAIGTPSSAAHDVTVQDIGIVPNHSTQATYYVNGAGCRIDGGTATPSQFYDVTFRRVGVTDSLLGINCHATEASASANYTAGDQFTRWVAEDCYIDTTANKAIEWSQARDSHIRRPVCRNVYDGPQVIFWSTRCTITDLDVEAIETGVSVTEGCKDITVRGGRITMLAGSAQGASSLGAVAIRREPVATEIEYATNVRIEGLTVDATNNTAQRAFGFHRHVSGSKGTVSGVVVTGCKFTGYVDFYDWGNPTDYGAAEAADRLRFVGNTVVTGFRTSGSWYAPDTVVEGCTFVPAVTLNADGVKVLGSSFEGALTVAGDAVFLDDNVIGGALTLSGSGTVEGSNFYGGSWVTPATAAAGAYAGVNAQTGTTYTPVLTDEGKLVTLTNAAAVTVTLPQDADLAFPVGSRIDWVGNGAGLVTFAAGTGATVNGTALTTTAQYSAATTIKTAANTWLVVGDLS